MIFSCIGLNNEHPSSFVDVTEGEINVEIDELFSVEMLPFIQRLWCSLLYSILTHGLGADADNISSMSTPPGNPLFYLTYLLVETSYIFFVQSPLKPPLSTLLFIIEFT